VIDSELEPTEDNPILKDILRDAHNAQATGSRFSGETKLWAFELLQTCGVKALDIVRRHVPLPSRQALRRAPPIDHICSDLTDYALAGGRAHQWRLSVTSIIGGTAYPRCILACDALACVPSIEVTSEGIQGLDLNDLDLSFDLLEGLTSSSEEFRAFVQGHWDRVLHAAFVYQVQPLDPHLSPFVIYAQPARDGKARDAQTEALRQLKELIGRRRITIGGFATDGDPGYNELHKAQSERNMQTFVRFSDVPRARHYHPISDILHILKRARYRMVKKVPMVVGLETDTAELRLERLIGIIGNDLPSVVFSDDPITKMHDSLPIALFRFGILQELYEAREFGWFGYFFPWVLINEAMSNKKAEASNRVAWFLIAYCYLMTCLETYELRPCGPGMSAFGTKKQNRDERAIRRTLFDRDLLMHASNSIAAIVFEIRIAKGELSLQRISTVPLEKKFGVTRMHARTHQTLSAIVKTMAVDEAMKFVSAHQEIKKKRLAYGETVKGYPWNPNLDSPPVLFAEAVLWLVGFPCSMTYAYTRCELEGQDDALHSIVHGLVSDELTPFAKTDFSMMSSRRRRSLYQELKGVTPSARRMLISSKSQMGGVISGGKVVHPIEQRLAELLGRRRLSLQDLKVLLTAVSAVAHVSVIIEDGEHRHSLNRATKRELLAWISAHWEEYHELVISMTANQRNLPAIAQ
jgi:hypothetical protein